MVGKRFISAMAGFGLLLSACGQADADAAAAGTEDAAGAAVEASADTQTPPPEVEAWIQSVREECAEAGGRFEGISDHLIPGDFNGDGRTDYVLSWGGVSCPDEFGSAGGALGGGNSGPRNDFLISQADGGHEIVGGFNSFLEASNIERRGERDVVVINGTWFQPGGEVHKVIWGWNGSAMDVIERQDAQGRPVDDQGRLIRAGGSAASGAALPFREGGYQPVPVDPEYYGSLSITATTVRYGDTAADVMCQVQSRDVQGSTARLTLDCGECMDADCRSLDRYGSPYTVTIRAESQTRLRITGIQLGYGDGVYEWVDPNA